MMIRLSPINRRGLFQRLAAYESTRNDIDRAANRKGWVPHNIRSVEGKKEGPRRVYAYECPVCDELHHFEDDAADCCASDAREEDPDSGAMMQCPVCGVQADSYQEAADCCLWKDVDQATRHMAADLVEGGATWLEAMEAASIALTPELAMLKTQQCREVEQS